MKRLFAKAMAQDPSHNGDDPRDAFGEILEGVGELLAWEQGIGGVGLPDLPRRAVTTTSAVPTAAPQAPVARAAATVAHAPASAPPRPATKSSTGALAPMPRTEAPDAARVARLAVLAQEAAGCTKCVLHRERTKSVFARGNPMSPIVFVGEGPGFNEDQQGLPFVGKAGQLLDRMIQAMGFDPADVYICNVVKCRPPDNRTPLPDEAKACEPYLIGQLEAVAPKLIVALGRCAAENLGATEPGGRDWRGRFTEWRGVPVMSTYHPAYLLRNENMKRPVWEDLQQAMGRLRAVMGAGSSA